MQVVISLQGLGLLNMVIYEKEERHAPLFPCSMCLNVLLKIIPDTIILDLINAKKFQIIRDKNYFNPNNIQEIPNNP